jgi:copper transport protein
VRGARWLIFLVCVVAAFAGLAEPASAHAVLERSAPADGAVLRSSPGAIAMVFDEPVGISLGSVMVYDSRGRRVDNGGPYHPSGNGKAVSEKVPSDLPAGGYVVTWRVVSADSHPVHGAFTFQIGAAGSRTALRGEAASLLARGQGSRVVGVVFGIDRAVGFLALAVLIGGMLLLALAWRAGAAEARIRRLLWGAWLLAIVATAAAIMLQGPYGAGLPLRDAVSPPVMADVLQSRFGQLSLIRLVALVAVAWPLLHLLLSTRRQTQPALPRWWAPAAVVTASVILLTVGLAGHASTGRWVVLAIPFDFVHLAGVAVWVGGLAVLVTGLLFRRAGSAVIPHHAIVVFSQLALLSIIAIAGSGGFAAWRQVGSLGNLTTTPYGRLVLIKIGLFCVIVVLGACSRVFTHGALDPPLFRRRNLPLAVPAGDSVSGPARRRPDTAESPDAWPSLPQKRQARLGRTTTTELVVAGAVLAVAALLVNAEPARLDATRPLAAEVHAGPDVLVDVTLDNTRAGPNNLHVYTLSRAGTQLIVPEIRATLSQPARSIANLPVHLSIAGAGHFISLGLNIPVPGRWTLDLIVRTSAFDEYDASPVTFSLT